MVDNGGKYVPPTTNDNNVEEYQNDDEDHTKPNLK